MPFFVLSEPFNFFPPNKSVKVKTSIYCIHTYRDVDFNQPKFNISTFLSQTALLHQQLLQILWAFFFIIFFYYLHFLKKK